MLAIAGLASAAHAETRPRYGGTVEASLLGAPASLDPVAAQSHAELTVADLVFDTLYRVGPSGVIVPHLAAAVPELDASRTRLTIPLRKGVRFHDGTPLTAADVAASLARVRAGAARWTLAPVATITAAPSGEAIELVLRAPIGEPAALLALPQTAITKSGKPPTAERAIGSGPFQLEGFDRAQRRLRLRAFDDHFAGRPYLEQLVLGWYASPDGEARRFETGGSQLSARGVGAFAGSQPKFRADHVEGPAALLVFAGFGRAHPEVTGDRGFRRALDLAIARDALKTVTSGERVAPAHAPVPVEAGGSAPAAAARTGDL
ncbi:MAG: ABC transporter substrate-binding protein, partial [Myxococcota bacterium]|nr:ABC transporter substrate-binding protein [Myxococcota bacterium]